MPRAPRTHDASVRHLSRDPDLGAFIRGYGPPKFRRSHAKNPFRSLAEAIIYQQVSGAAAATICRRFVALFPGKKPSSTRRLRRGGFPTPADVLKTPEHVLRSAGLSRQKASYIRDLALKFSDGTINPRSFARMSDEELIAHITMVKGVGEWTVQMFLMFTLARPDVLPTADLGIQKGFQKLFKLRSRPDAKKMKRLATRWAGHRTVACFYLWRLMDT